MGTREVIGWMNCTASGGSQWVLEVERDPNDPTKLLFARFRNPVRQDTATAKAGDPSFYTVEARGDTPFGNPLVVQEPEYAIPVPTGVTYRRPRRDKSGRFEEMAEIAPDELKIIGYVIKDGNDVVGRSSFSGMRVFKGVMPPVINEDGTLEHDGKTWHLQSLRHPDRDRFDASRFGAVFGPSKPDFVSVLELYDF